MAFGDKDQAWSLREHVLPLSASPAVSETYRLEARLVPRGIEEQGINTYGSKRRGLLRSAATAALPLIFVPTLVRIRDKRVFALPSERPGGIVERCRSSRGRDIGPT